MKEKGEYITHPKYKKLAVYKYKVSTYIKQERNTDYLTDPLSLSLSDITYEVLPEVPPRGGP